MPRVFKQGRLSYSGMTFNEKVMETYGEVVYSPMQIEAIFDHMGYKVNSKDIENYALKEDMVVSGEDFGLRPYKGTCLTTSWILKSKLVKIASGFKIKTNRRSIESVAKTLKYAV
jgi:hypothetical protein